MAEQYVRKKQHFHVFEMSYKRTIGFTSPGYVLVDVDILVLPNSITWEVMSTARDLTHEKHRGRPKKCRVCPEGWNRQRRSKAFLKDLERRWAHCRSRRLCDSPWDEENKKTRAEKAFRSTSFSPVTYSNFPIWESDIYDRRRLAESNVEP
jgi:hypothetical protein